MEASGETFRGVVRGNTIALAEDVGLPDGQEVAVTVRAVGQGAVLAPGEGIKRSFGAWADNQEGLDDFLKWNREQRKIGRRDFES